MEGDEMKNLIDFLVAVLGPALYVLLLVGAALGLLVGIFLILDSARVFRWNASLNRWFSTEEAARVFDKPRDVKRFIYRRHRVAGVFVVAGALYAMDVLLFRVQTGAVLRALNGVAHPDGLRLIADSLRIFLIAGNAVALLAGLVLCFRPSMLKGVEIWADKQYAVQSGKSLDQMNFVADEFVLRHPRLVGALVAAGSLFVLVSLGLRW
jgi:hypothetical protein